MDKTIFYTYTRKKCSTSFCSIILLDVATTKTDCYGEQQHIRRA